MAANTKAVLCNVAHRPVFKGAIGGKPGQQASVQEGVMTQLNGVQMAVPIKDGGAVVGVMKAAIIAP